MAKKTAKRIERLTLRGFRGATTEVTVDFDTQKPIVMIFGENGSGKSTLVDALDFVCNEEFGSLKDRSSTKPQKHLVSLGSSASDLSVSINYDGKDWRAYLAKNGPHADGPAGRPIAHILRRSSVLRLIEAQPNKRYEAIQDFIALPQIEKVEKALRDAIKDVEQQREKALLQRQQAEEQLQEFWEEEGRQGRDHMSWAQRKAGSDSDYLKSVVGSVNSILLAMNEAINARAQLLSAVAAHDHDLEQQHIAEEKLTASVNLEGQDSRTIIELLREARHFLAKHPDAATCPLCEQTIEVAALGDRIESRLAAMSHILELKEKAEAARNKTNTTAAFLSHRRKEFVSSVQKLAPLLEESPADDVAAIDIDWSKYSNLVDNTLINAMADTGSPEVIQEALDLLSAVERYREEWGEYLVENRRTLDQLNAIRINFNAVNEKRRQAAEQDRQAKGLTEILEVVEGQRKGYVEDTLKMISDSVETLYERLHPGEGIGKVRLFLKPNVPRSMEIGSTFQGVDELPPGAYYSESHLDTLGVAIFLALAKYYNNADAVVVLDDVITSVDDVHMERFIQMLHDEGDHFNQIIVTTHYRAWRDRYKYSRGPEAAVHMIELLSWSHPKGVRHTKTKLVIDDLRHWVQVEPLERQVVASKCGLLLESLLDYIALRYRCKLPRQPEPNYTLGDFTNAMDKKLVKALKVEKLKSNDEEGERILESLVGNSPRSGELDGQHVRIEATALQSQIEEISNLAWIRNQIGCHFSLAGMSVSDNDVFKLAKKTIELTEALVCDSCGELPQADKSGVYWNCRCKRTRLYPLKQPV
jgi:recombinational DNA repair ATPase RecF